MASKDAALHLGEKDRTLYKELSENLAKKDKEIKELTPTAQKNVDSQKLHRITKERDAVKYEIDLLMQSNQPGTATENKLYDVIKLRSTMRDRLLKEYKATKANTPERRNSNSVREYALKRPSHEQLPTITPKAEPQLKPALMLKEPVSTIEKLPAIAQEARKTVRENTSANRNSDKQKQTTSALKIDNHAIPRKPQKPRPSQPKKIGFMRSIKRALSAKSDHKKSAMPPTKDSLQLKPDLTPLRTLRERTQKQPVNIAALQIAAINKKQLELALELANGSQNRSTKSKSTSYFHNQNIKRHEATVREDDEQQRYYEEQYRVQEEHRAQADADELARQEQELEEQKEAIEEQEAQLQREEQERLAAEQAQRDEEEARLAAEQEDYLFTYTQSLYLGITADEDVVTIEVQEDTQLSVEEL
ncbi:hypothetical protein [uncultured Endozoicomonas sp.]|uniref:hypothetical protein n=1 Tax=uncultured Endozoicomonas sp. TaxID=432652 RepID=UPI002601887C|nr:hypothetical protein [uncultured Endozoicomonas sp.]